MARIWREGQKKPCFIYRFLCDGTIEGALFFESVRTDIHIHKKFLERECSNCVHVAIFCFLFYCDGIEKKLQRQLEKEKLSNFIIRGDDGTRDSRKTSTSSFSRDELRKIFQFQPGSFYQFSLSTVVFVLSPIPV